MESQKSKLPSENNLSESVLAEKIVYHGSRNTFDKFSLDYAGSDQGTNIAWGLYFSDNTKGASFYKDLGGKNGRLYKVNIPDKPYLNWNEPIGNQKEIRKILMNTKAYQDADKRAAEGGFLSGDQCKGSEFYGGLDHYQGMNPKEASKYLYSLGIKGIKYKHDNYFNYILFNAEDAKIVSTQEAIGEAGKMDPLKKMENLGIKLSDEEDAQGNLVIVAKKNGKTVGSLNVDASMSRMHPNHVEVNPRWRRKGIGTAMYVYAEKVSGNKFAYPENDPDFNDPDTDLPATADALKLWDQPNRPFGESVGDWKKHGIKFSHKATPEKDGDKETGNITYEITAESPDGDVAGNFEFFYWGEPGKHFGTLDAQSSNVAEKYRRLGIATEAYRMIEVITGKKISRGGGARQSGDAQKLWDQPNRPFGENVEEGKKDWPESVKEFLKAWDYEEYNHAIKLLKSNPEIMTALKECHPNTSMTLYRGFHFLTNNEALGTSLSEIKKLLNVDVIKKGMEGTLTSKQISSWSKSKSVAKNFAFYNDGFDEYGLLLQATFSAKQILSDLTCFGKLMELNEKEVLVNAGRITYKIIDIHLLPVGTYFQDDDEQSETTLVLNGKSGKTKRTVKKKKEMFVSRGADESIKFEEMGSVMLKARSKNYEILQGKLSTLNEMIKKLGPHKFRLYSKKGKKLGTFFSKAAAQKREKQINFFKQQKESLDEKKGFGKYASEYIEQAIQFFLDVLDIDDPGFDKKLTAQLRTTNVTTFNPKEAHKIRRNHGHTFSSNPWSSDETELDNKAAPSTVIKFGNKLFCIDGQHRMNHRIALGLRVPALVIDGSWMKEFGITASSFSDMSIPKIKPVDELIKDESNKLGPEHEGDFWEGYTDDKINEKKLTAKNVRFEIEDSSGGGFEIIAKSGDEVIGSAAINESDSHGIVIDAIEVNEKFRGKGIGEELLKRAIKEIKKRYPGVEISLDAMSMDDDTDLERLIRFYKRYGFKVTKNYPGSAVMVKEDHTEGPALDDFLQSRIHHSFTLAADDLCSLGYMDSDKRIALSSAIGDGLEAFRQAMDKKAPWAKKMKVDPGHTARMVLESLENP